MKIICIGRNYSDHAKELNNPVPLEPVFFMKPDTALLPKRNPVYIPDFTNNLNYEVELVIKINKTGKKIASKFAHKYYNEIGIGIDFTARDLQEKCKKNGLPWEMAKAFDHSAPISNKFISKEEFKDLKNINFSLKKNKETVQVGNSADMLFNFDEIISYVSRFVTLKIGDLIFTGTPAGVGKVEINDQLEAFLEDQLMLKVTIK